MECSDVYPLLNGPDHLEILHEQYENTTKDAKNMHKAAMMLNGITLYLDVSCWFACDVAYSKIKIKNSQFF